MQHEQWQRQWKDYYQILGVAPDSEQAQIIDAFRYKAQILHPDRLGASPEKVRERAHRELIEANEAYEVLLDPRRRVAYHLAWLKRRSAARAPSPQSSRHSRPEPASVARPMSTTPSPRTEPWAGRTESAKERPAIAAPFPQASVPQPAFLGMRPGEKQVCSPSFWATLLAAAIVVTLAAFVLQGLLPQARAARLGEVVLEGLAGISTAGLSLYVFLASR